VEAGARSTVVIWVVAAALAVVAAIRLFGGGGPDAPPVSIDAPVRSDRTNGTSSSRAGDEGQVYVHVAGAVRRPGLIRVPPGTRVATALGRAGGPTRRADLTLVNVAARVQDGQQIVVPAAAATGAASGGAAAPGSGATVAAPGAKIHLSTATPEQLDEVDGIGPALAERIVEYRDTHGGFRSIEELAEVEGIGEKRLATLRDALQP
jgi:competence protein ComEA